MDIFLLLIIFVRSFDDMKDCLEGKKQDCGVLHVTIDSLIAKANENLGRACDDTPYGSGADNDDEDDSEGTASTGKILILKGNLWQCLNFHNISLTVHYCCIDFKLGFSQTLILNNCSF